MRLDLSIAVWRTARLGVLMLAGLTASCDEPFGSEGSVSKAVAASALAEPARNEQLTFYCSVSYRQPTGGYRYGLLRNRIPHEDLAAARNMTGYFLYLVRDSDGLTRWGAYCQVPLSLAAVDAALRRLGTSLGQVRSQYRSKGAATASVLPLGALLALLQHETDDAIECEEGYVAGYDPYSDQWGCYQPPVLAPIIVTAPPDESEPPPPDDPYDPPPSDDDDQDNGGSDPGTPPPPPTPTDDQGCGDERDYMITEYSTWGINMTPTCEDFASSASSMYFTFGEYNRNGYHGWAIVRNYLMSGADATRSAYGAPLIVGGSYRCPEKQSDVNSAAMQSRHIYGDAIDFDTYSDPVQWDEVKAAAKANQACVEPVRLSTYDHVHADWRGTCPNADW